jgi:signal transduction histidine kinase
MQINNILSSRSRLRRVLALVILGYIIISGYFVIWSYNNSLAEAENASLMRLLGIANSLALQIDGDAHQHLFMDFMKKDDVKTTSENPDYAKIHRVLKANFDANMLKTPVYTIVFDSLMRKYEFGVTSSENPYFRHAYTSAPLQLIEKQQESAQIPMYEDEFGMWLSAFATVKNSKGQNVALVQADEKFDEFLQRERSKAWRNIMMSLLGFALLFLLLVRLLQPLLRKEREDKEALEKAFAQIKNLSEELEINLQKVTSLDIFRKEMIANLSHDLRTPMVSVLGYAETIVKKKSQLSTEEHDRYLNIILTEAKRMERFIKELFELTKLEAKQIKLEPEPFQIAELAHDTLQKYQLRIKEKNIRFMTQIQENLPLVFADLQWIDRVLQNLLDNAVRYTDEGGFIMFTIFLEENKVHFKVCNSGQPIDNEHLANIFDRYFKSTNANQESTGLGLTIVKKIMDLHEEKISCEVNDDVTTFRFTLSVYG